MSLFIASWKTELNKKFKGKIEVKFNVVTFTTPKDSLYENMAFKFSFFAQCNKLRTLTCNSDIFHPLFSRNIDISVDTCTDSPTTVLERLYYLIAFPPIVPHLYDLKLIDELRTEKEFYTGTGQATTYTHHPEEFATMFYEYYKKNLSPTTTVATVLQKIIDCHRVYRFRLEPIFGNNFLTEKIAEKMDKLLAKVEPRKMTIKFVAKNFTDFSLKQSEVTLEVSNTMSFQEMHQQVVTKYFSKNIKFDYDITINYVVLSNDGFIFDYEKQLGLHDVGVIAICDTTRMLDFTGGLIKKLTLYPWVCCLKTNFRIGQSWTTLVHESDAPNSFKKQLLTLLLILHNERNATINYQLPMELCCNVFQHWYKLLN